MGAGRSAARPAALVRRSRSACRWPRRPDRLPTKSMRWQAPRASLPRDQRTHVCELSFRPRPLPGAQIEAIWSLRYTGCLHGHSALSRASCRLELVRTPRPARLGMAADFSRLCQEIWNRCLYWGGTLKILDRSINRSVPRQLGRWCGQSRRLCRAAALQPRWPGRMKNGRRS